MGVKVREKVKGSGEWWIFIEHQGKRKSKKVGRDKRLATDAARKIEAKLVLGDFDLLDEKEHVPSLREYALGWSDNETDHVGWLKKAEYSLKSSTRKGYKSLIKNTILSTFDRADTPMDEITSRHMSEFVYASFKKGLRSNTIKNIKNCMSAIFRQACIDGYIPANPARGVLVPTPEDETPSREPMPFSWKDRAIFEAKVKEHHPRYFPLIICGFRSGLRFGELAALRWQDVDFQNKLIYVQRNITRGKETTPKSRAGVRYVRMTNQLCLVLKAHKKILAREALKKGWGAAPEWVFPSEEGSFLNHGNFIYRVWNPVMKKSELIRRTPHDMRHTYATLRLSKGDSLAEVSKEMGHGSPDITYRTYYKWMPKESNSDINELDGRQPRNTPNRTLSAPEIRKR